MKVLAKRLAGSLRKAEISSIVAAFGVPTYQEDHAVRACYAALENRMKLEHVNERLREMLEEKQKRFSNYL